MSVEIDISNIETVKKAYQSFNSKNAGAAICLMDENIVWPNTLDGGVVTGKKDLLAYWHRHFNQADYYTEPLCFEYKDDGTIIITVHAVVKTLDGELLKDQMVYHIYKAANGVIQSMTIENIGD